MIRYKRAERVAGVLQKELSELLLRKIRDPRLSLVTITHVSITDDLRSARIYFAVAGSQERILKARAGFRSATGYLRQNLSRRLALKCMPTLKFVYDESFDRAANIDKLLKTIATEANST